MKSIFHVCKESVRKTVKAKLTKIYKALSRISLKKENREPTFYIKLQFKDVHVFPFDLQFVFFSEKLADSEHSEVAVRI